MKQKHKLFVLCNDKFKDDPVYACVQGGHAVAQYMLDNVEYDEYWKNDFLIYLWMSQDAFDRIDQTGYSFGYPFFRDIPISIWREPDQNNVITSIAVFEDDIMEDSNGDVIMRMLKKLNTVK
ncbi:MAG: hypothetical protein [Wendovervirus sonii]|uniref:Aminoacyl-tRNA hydrolase n=1 Tax=phage Lak_Megaphage_Sonny TaxID=3109229 RepID=A0ABZ0Z3I7_9CAUD|nr:MAG: hypothetical protein [phage Lak_Megaphage_Sonny]